MNNLKIQRKVVNTDLDRSVLLRSNLTHYHTMPHFDTFNACSCGKHCEKRRNCL